MNRLRVLATSVALLALVLTVPAGGAFAGTATHQAPKQLTHFQPLAPQSRLGRSHANRSPNAGTVDCTRSYSTNADVNMDCASTIAPNNEMQIAVDPNDSNHMIASSNDYESCCDEFYTTFDGGFTWQSGDMSNEGGDIFGSDPASAISKQTGTAFHISLNIANDLSFSDVVVSRSLDGGLVWDAPVLVDHSAGALFNDKEWITVDNSPSSPFYGRIYATWTRFNGTAAQNSPIFMSYSSDDGLTWTTRKMISGNSKALCTYQAGGPANACDEDQFSVPSVGPDGTVYVNFINEQNTALWEPGEVFDDQILVVHSTNGGVKWTSPAMAASLEDGSLDYPINVDGRQTLTGEQMRLGQNTSGVAGITAGSVYVVWSDNRNGVHDSSNPVTNSDVFIASSTDKGNTWSAPQQVTTNGADQWQAWMDIDPVTGRLGVVYFDRGYGDPSLYDLTYARTGGGGGFHYERVTTRPSDPTHSFFFQAGVPGCEQCSRFIGDYIGIAFGSNGAANITWTDMRKEFRMHGHLEHGFFSRR